MQSCGHALDHPASQLPREEIEGISSLRPHRTIVFAENIGKRIEQGEDVD
jgi:hypothetical protein